MSDAEVREFAVDSRTRGRLNSPATGAWLLAGCSGRQNTHQPNFHTQIGSLPPVVSLLFHLQHVGALVAAHRVPEVNLKHLQANSLIGRRRPLNLQLGQITVLQCIVFVSLQNETG